MEDSANQTQSTTELYIALSNSGNLTAIQALFDPQATYSSAHTGLYYGITDIMAMMNAYFKSHQSLHWQIDAISTLTEHISEVHFTCKTLDTDGKTSVRTGIERVVVVDGLIRHIEVR